MFTNSLSRERERERELSAAGRHLSITHGRRASAEFLPSGISYPDERRSEA